MKTFDVPNWMIAPFKSQGVSQSDYFLYGAGRALVFVRMAAYALDEAPNDQNVAEYHAYTGISAARTAIDATASWCNVALELNVTQGNQVNLSRQDFRGKLSQVQPEISKYVECLGTLGKQIDEHRQKAQHREGLAIRNKFSRKSQHLNGWHIAPMGLGGDHIADLRLVDLLNGWADEIEENLRKIHKVLVMASGEMQEVEQRIAWLSKLNSFSLTQRAR